ncbi:FecR family protein, partial [Steroidobacter sp.]|uniref:FecR family protein n=1 Tax=Steroidobacter sp. TaxID=1978227 RepID=UPI001A517C57
AHSYDAATLIAQARQSASQVIPLTLARSQAPASASDGKRTLTVRRVRAFALAAGVACAAVGLATLVWMKQNPLYASMVGEQRSIVLADGSEITLNSRTKVRVRLTDEQRRIELIEGQALFRVAKDPQRPFIVHSGDTAVRAVGTVFDVYRKSSGTVVTVTEGRVSVSGAEVEATAAAGSTQTPVSQGELTPLPLYVSAGQQLIVTAAGSQQGAQSVDDATAWTSRKMIFKDARLADVAAEFNRYNVKQLAVTDQDLQDLRISAIFSSTNAASLLNYLKTQPGIVVREQGSQIFIEKRGASVSTP